MTPLINFYLETFFFRWIDENTSPRAIHRERRRRPPLSIASATYYHRERRRTHNRRPSLLLLPASSPPCPAPPSTFQRRRRQPTFQHHRRPLRHIVLPPPHPFSLAAEGASSSPLSKGEEEGLKRSSLATVSPPSLIARKRDWKSPSTRIMERCRVARGRRWGKGSGGGRGGRRRGCSCGWKGGGPMSRRPGEQRRWGGRATCRQWEGVGWGGTGRQRGRLVEDGVVAVLLEDEGGNKRGG